MNRNFRNGLLWALLTMASMCLGQSKVQVRVRYMQGFSKHSSSAEAGGVQNQSVMMPAFRWTSKSGVGAAFWKSITDMGGGLLPYVAFGSYEGTSHTNQKLVRRNEDAEQFLRNKGVGIKSLGYTYTRQSSRPLQEVFADIDNFVNFYGRENIAGYFVDEVMGGSTQEQIDYMASIYRYVKGKYPEMTVLANNGGGIRDGIAPYADIWMTQEVTADTYINHYQKRSSAFEKDAANADKILHVVHTASPEQYEEIIRLSRERNAGRLFITSDTNAYPSGYDDLPTYFEALLLSINNFTPTSGSLLSKENLTGTHKVMTEMPRSKVDLDLAKALQANAYRNLEETEDGAYRIDVAYMNNFGGNYKDKVSNVQYDGQSNGVQLNVSKDLGDFVVGVALGYQQSDVRYNGKYNGVSEDIKSYQVGINAMYNASEHIDVAASVLYAANKHQFATRNGLGAMAGAEYTSGVWDFGTRVGYKWLADRGYIKPYLGVGMTHLREGRIGKLNFSDTARACLNGSVGAMAAQRLGRFLLSGEVTYEQRFDGASYHSKRTYNTRYELAPLSYASGVINVEAGVGYRISDRWSARLAYELRESKYSVAEVGIAAQL